MKKNKLILAAKILAVVIICLIAFVGIYVQKANKMENVVKDYKLGKDLEGYREFTLKISDAYKVALFNLNNINNIITDFLDKTVNYIYSIYEFGLSTAIQFDK